MDTQCAYVSRQWRSKTILRKPLGGGVLPKILGEPGFGFNMRDEDTSLLRANQRYQLAKSFDRCSRLPGLYLEAPVSQVVLVIEI